MVRPCDQRVIIFQRNEDCASTTVGDLVQAVVEKLAEDCEQGIEGRRKADVGGHVRDKQGFKLRHTIGICRMGSTRNYTLVALGPGRITGHEDGSRVGRCLVNDQVANHARPGVVDCTIGLVVVCRTTRSEKWRGRFRRPFEIGRGQAREWLVRRAESLLAGLQVVAGPVHRPKAEGKERARDLVSPRADKCTTRPRCRCCVRGMVLGDLDLLKYERQVGSGDRKP